MRVLIVGAGNSGRHLAAKLCEMSHEVVVVDQAPDRLVALDARLDVMTVAGSGSSPDVLEKAELAKADLLIAVTNSDEVNILACHFAHVAGVANTVARIVNSELQNSPLLDCGLLGIDCLVSQNGEAAEDLIARVRFIAAMRGESAYLPRGNTRFEVGDDVYVAVQPGDLRRFLDWVYPGRQAFEKSVIAGGGGLGLNLVRRLETESTPVVLLERDAVRAEECSDTLHKTLVLHGDASDQETMVNAGVGPDTAFVAITGDEELNIISCMLAHKLGAVFTVALVSKPEYVPVIRSLGLLSRVVSPHLSMINAILHFVRGKHVRAAVCLHKAPGELLHVVVRKRHRWAGKPISDIKMPDDCLIAAVLRDDAIRVPIGDLMIQEGDQLVIFALPAAVGRVQSMFKS